MPAIASNPPSAIVFAELGDGAEVRVGGGRLPVSFGVRSWQRTSAAVLDELVGLLGGPEAGRQDHDQVLEALRQLGHPALAVGQLELVLAASRR